MSYYFSKIIDGSFDDAIERVTMMLISSVIPF